HRNFKTHCSPEGEELLKPIEANHSSEGSLLDERRPVHLPRSLSMLVMVRAVKQRHIPNPARAPGLSTLSETRGSAPPYINTHPLCPCPTELGLGAELVRETMPDMAGRLSCQPRWRTS